MAFVETERIKHTIMLREGKTSLWSYFSHCSAMSVLIALAVCQGPLLYDYTLIYKVNRLIVWYNLIFFYTFLYSHIGVKNNPQYNYHDIITGLFR